MNLLLDSHAFLWFDQAPEKLSVAAAQALLGAEHELWLSVASLWELELKVVRGALQLADSLEDILARQIAVNGLRALEINHTHALRAARLPDHHRDPFDRMIIAQALVEGMTVVSIDREFPAYNVPLIW